MFARFAALLALLCATTLHAAPNPDKIYHIAYTIEFEPKTDSARVTIRLDNSGLVKRLNFAVPPARYHDIRADGELSVEGGRAIWNVPPGGGALSLVAKVSHQRSDGAYDARMTRDFVIVRGDDLVPSARVLAIKGATSRARLRFKFPPGWTHVDTGFIKESDGSFAVDNPRRSFDRPVGWMIAGRIGTRRETIGDSEIAVGAPVGSALRRMDALTFIGSNWAEAEHAFGKMPRKLLVVGDGDPMWRGGLSSPNSMFLHADRPLVSENGTSSVLHELTHVVTRIRGQRNDDWIAEGLAEFYSIELMHRSGLTTDDRYERTRDWLKRWSASVTKLRVPQSKARTTGRAVLLLMDLDREIRKRSGGKRDIDDVTRGLMHIRKVSLDDLRKVSEKLVGGPLKTLDSPLLK